MTRKYNQYRNRATRAAGSGAMDLNDKNEVKRILQDMGAESIRFDQFLGITHTDRYAIYGSMTKTMSMKYRKIRHPDVVAWYKDQWIIIEIDGAYHADFDHDKDYDDIGIKYLKLNKDYLKKEGISFEKWIREFL